MQGCGKYQPCRIFIKSTLVTKIKMSSVKTQAAIFRDKSGVNQHNKVLRKQQSLDLRLKKLFPNEEIIEEYSALHYRTDFTFEKHMLVVELIKKGMLTDFQIMKSLYELQNLGYHLIRINAGKTDFNDYEEFGRVNSYIAESTKKQTKKSLIDDLSKGLLELK